MCPWFYHLSNALAVDDHENMTFLTRTQACKGVDRALFDSNIPQKEEKKQGIEGTIVKSCKKILSNILLPSLVFVRFKGMFYCKKKRCHCVCRQLLAKQKNHFATKVLQIHFPTTALCTKSYLNVFHQP